MHQIILYVSSKTFYKKYTKLTMAIDDKIRYEKLQYDINREAARILAF